MRSARNAAVARPSSARYPAASSRAARSPGSSTPATSRRLRAVHLARLTPRGRPSARRVPRTRTPPGSPCSSRRGCARPARTQRSPGHRGPPRPAPSRPAAAGRTSPHQTAVRRPSSRAGVGDDDVVVPHRRAQRATAAQQARAPLGQQQRPAPAQRPAVRGQPGRRPSRARQHQAGSSSVSIALRVVARRRPPSRSRRRRRRPARTAGRRRRTAAVRNRAEPEPAVVGRRRRRTVQDQAHRQAGAVAVPGRHRGPEADVAAAGRRGDLLEPDLALGSVRDRPPGARVVRTGAAPGPAPGPLRTPRPRRRRPRRRPAAPATRTARRLTRDGTAAPPLSGRPPSGSDQDGRWRLEPAGVDVGDEDAAGAERPTGRPSPGWCRARAPSRAPPPSRSSCSGETVGDSMPGRQPHGLPRRSSTGMS